MGRCVRYTGVFLHQRTHLRTHSLQVVHISVYVYTCVYACICIRMRMCVYDIVWHVEALLLRFSICAYVCICMRIYMCVHVCVYRCMCICMYITVFGKRCECIAQKCTHLERLPPLASHLLLSHCLLTQHGGKKEQVTHMSVCGDRTRVCRDSRSCGRQLCHSNSRTQWVVLNEKC